MSDDLHTALPTCWYCPDCQGVWRYEPDYTEHDDCDDEGTPIVVSLIPPGAASDPVRRLAILNAMGLDVTEGFLTDYEDEEGRAKGYTDYAVIFVQNDDYLNWPCLVVRPRGEGQ